MIKPNQAVFEAILSLRGKRDWQTFFNWLIEVSHSETYNAIRSANPQVCGGAAVLQDLIEIISGAEKTLDKMTAKHR